MTGTAPQAVPDNGIELSVVVPVLDEEGCILPLLAELNDALDGRIDYEIVVVDDGSRDATPEELAGARELYPRLRVITHRRRCGQSGALHTGIRHARGEWIATMDGDGQNDPADVMNLWATREREPSVGLVCGIRTKRHDPWTKRIASKVANGVRGWILGDGISDTGCGLKLFRRRHFLELPRFDHMHRFLPALMRAAGVGISACPVAHRSREHGRSKYGVFDRLAVGVPDLVGVWWLMRRMMRSGGTEPGDGA